MDPVGYFLIVTTIRLLPWVGLASFILLVKPAANSKWLSSQKEFVQYSVFWSLLIAGLFVLGWLTNCTRLAEKVLEPLSNPTSSYVKRLIKEIEEESEDRPSAFDN